MAGSGDNARPSGAGASLFVVDGPAGAGKSHLLRHVERTWPGIVAIPKLTTRRRRPSETSDGWSDLVHVSPDRFERASPEFRYRFRGHWYGVSERDIRSRLHGGRAALVVVRDLATIRRLSGRLSDLEVVPVLVRASAETRRARLEADGLAASEIEERVREREADPSNDGTYREIIDNDASATAFHERIAEVIRRHVAA